MVHKKAKSTDDNFKLSMASAVDLKGRQSVRATFNLTEGCIDAISIVATQMGIKQKSIFENLADNVNDLSAIAREIKKSKTTSVGPIKKTFVISRKALTAIKDVAKAFNISRDTLIEYSIQRLLPIIDKEREKHAIRKDFLEKIDAHLEEGKKILNDIQQQLGNDDPIIGRFSTVMNGYETAKEGIEKFINRSLEIEDFKADKMGFNN